MTKDPVANIIIACWNIIIFSRNGDHYVILLRLKSFHVIPRGASSFAASCTASIASFWKKSFWDNLPTNADASLWFTFPSSIIFKISTIFSNTSRFISFLTTRSNTSGKLVYMYLHSLWKIAK